MNFENLLISGLFIKRYKRFFVDVKIKEKTITAHCPNTGSMYGLLKKGNKVWYNEIGKKPGTKHSQHPRHLNKRYMKTFKTKSAAEKEAKSISTSYDKKSKKKK